VFRGLDEAWEGDGLRRLEQEWRPDMIQFTFSVKPGVSPVFFAARVKGRLQHAFRLAGMPVAFSRKVAVRTIGKNTRNELEAYIRRQVNSPEEIALGFMNYLAHAFGQKPIWQAGYYVGSFGEYDMGAVRAPRGGEGTRG
jgi:REP element-mobilizing transposase RayT